MTYALRTKALLIAELKNCIKEIRFWSFYQKADHFLRAIKAAFESNMATKNAKAGEGVQLAEIIEEQSVKKCAKNMNLTIFYSLRLFFPFCEPN